MEGNMVDINWDFTFKEDVIHLKRTSPDGSTSAFQWTTIRKAVS